MFRAAWMSPLAAASMRIEMRIVSLDSVLPTRDLVSKPCTPIGADINTARKAAALDQIVKRRPPKREQIENLDFGEHAARLERARLDNLRLNLCFDALIAFRQR